MIMGNHGLMILPVNDTMTIIMIIYYKPLGIFPTQVMS